MLKFSVCCYILCMEKCSFSESDLQEIAQIVIDKENCLLFYDSKTKAYKKIK